MKSVLVGKFVAPHKKRKKRKKLERIQISGLVLHRKDLEKQEYTLSPKIKQERLKKDRGEIEDIYMRY